jgi:hypothetical protein
MNLESFGRFWFYDFTTNLVTVKCLHRIFYLEFVLNRKTIKNRRKRLQKHKDSPQSIRRRKSLDYIVSKRFLVTYGLYSPISSFTGKEGSSWNMRNDYYQKLKLDQESFEYCVTIINLSNDRKFLFMNVMGLITPALPIGIVLDVYTEIATSKFTSLAQKLLKENVVFAMKL